MVSQLVLSLSLPQEMQSHMPKAPPPDSTPPKFSSAVEELFRSRVEKVTVCRCEAEEVQEITEMVFPLHYPSTTLQEGKPLPYPFGTSTEDKLGEAHSPAAEERVPFSSVIQSCICSEQVTQAWCTKCDTFKRVVSGECINICIFTCHTNVCTCSPQAFSSHVFTIIQMLVTAYTVTFISESVIC